jgi:predicted PurR-regulated permease PerM
VVGILVLVSYILIQKLENYWLVPKVMERAIGLHPLVIILVLLAGGRLGGFMGLVLAVPLATVAGVFLRDVFEQNKG